MNDLAIIGSVGGGSIIILLLQPNLCKWFIRGYGHRLGGRTLSGSNGMHRRKLFVRFIKPVQVELANREVIVRQTVQRVLPQNLTEIPAPLE